MLLAYIVYSATMMVSLQVGDCLLLLHLGHYTECFRRNDVDGQLLCCLNETLLVNDFLFNTFEAKKLIMFAKKGGRPCGVIRHQSTDRRLTKVFRLF